MTEFPLNQSEALRQMISSGFMRSTGFLHVLLKADIDLEVPR